MAKTIEERMAIVKGICGDGGHGFGNGSLNQGTLKNRDICGVCTGYSFQLANLSYRGVWLSTIEGVKVIVDGEEVPQDHMMIELKGTKYPLCDVESHTEVFWDAKQPCSIIVYKIGGLAAGEHTLDVTVLKRADFGHSYGEGLQGYENAHEFHTPEVIHSVTTETI